MAGVGDAVASSSLGFADLHGDLLTEILQHLPDADKIRLQCVCKSWFTELADPQVHGIWGSLRIYGRTCDEGMPLGPCVDFRFGENVDAVCMWLLRRATGIRAVQIVLDNEPLTVDGQRKLTQHTPSDPPELYDFQLPQLAQWLAVSSLRASVTFHVQDTQQLVEAKPWESAGVAAIVSEIVLPHAKLVPQSHVEGLCNFTALQTLKIGRRDWLESDQGLVAGQTAGLGRLTALTEMQLQSNIRLTEVCDDMLQLTSLQKLTLENCSRLKLLPDGLSQLAALSELSLLHTQTMRVRLQIEPGAFLGPALRRMSISGCMLKGTTVASSQSLQALSFAACKNGSQHALCFGALPELRSLRLPQGECMRHNFMSTLTALQELWLPQRQLLSVVSAGNLAYWGFGHLTALTSLTLEIEMPPSQLVPAFALLSRLRHLAIVSQGQRTDFWQAFDFSSIAHLRNLRQLRTLLLEAVQRDGNCQHISCGISAARDVLQAVLPDCRLLF